MSFAEQKRIARLDYMLSKSMFAEEITYTPKGGVARQITIHARESQRIDLIEGDVTEERIEELNCLIGRDEAAVDSEGNPIGGVAQIQEGDSILRDASLDAWQREYVFKGGITQTTPELWRAVFERKARTVQGAPR